MSDKNKILNFSHDKFIKEGFYKTSIDEIASELKISKKTIYKYFPSKARLLDEVMDMRISNINKLLDEIVDSEDDTITKFLKLISCQKTFSLNCSPHWFRDIEVHAPHLKLKMDKLRSEKITRIMSKLLLQGKREKVVVNVPADILITALNGAIEAVTSSDFIYNSKYSFHDAMKITSEIFLSGIFTETGRRKYSNKKKLLEKALK
ncbi:MAG: TetR/AcrR family transcriptional regulator [Ignavibacteria bacterium]|nr:TetR/AcrR family transcriptional regulator [Ignavibacteria bacterium]